MATTINSNTTDGIVITPDTSGEIELQANGVTKAKVTANGLQDANGASLRGGMYRNLIINGDMNIAQRGTSVTGITSSGYKTVDRFSFSCSSFGTWTMSKDTNVPTGQGFASSVKLDCTTAEVSPSSNYSLSINQRIEGQNLQHLKKGTSSAESLTLSFWVKSNKTGTYTVELYDVDNTRQVSKTYTIDSADTWEKKTITLDGDTTGSFDNDNGLSLYLFFWLGSGSDYTSGTFSDGAWESATNANRVSPSQVNLADSTSNYINITGVQLEVGEGASDFEFLPYDVQLARCQRYYWKQVADLTARYSTGVQADNTTTCYATVTIPQVLRATPSIDWSDLVLRYGTTNTAISSSITVNRFLDNMNAVNLRITTTGLTGARVYQLRSDSATAYLEFESEL